MGRYSHLGKNSVLVFIGSIGSKLMSVFMLPFYTAWLSVDQYGDIDLISTYVSLIMSVICLCMTDAIFRFPKGYDKEDQSRFFSSGLFVASASMLLFGVLYFSTIFLWGSEKWGVIYTYSGYIYCFLILSFLQLYFQQFCRSIDKMGVFVVSGIVLTLSTVILSFILVEKYNIIGYIIAYLGGLFIASTYTFFTIKLYSYINIKKVSIPIAKEMLAYSVPMIPNATLWWILGTSNRLFLEYFHGVEPVGIFAVSNKFPSIITMVFNTFFLSWQISVLEEFKKLNFDHFYNNIFRFCFIVLAVTSLLLTFSSYWLVKVFADTNFLSAWRFIPFLGIAALFSAISSFCGSIFMVTKETRYFLTTSLWGAVVCLLLNFLLIDKYNIMGATISLLLSHGLIMVLRLIKVERHVALSQKNSYIIQLILIIGAAWISISVKSLIGLYTLCGLICLIFIYLNRNYIQLVKNKVLQTFSSVSK